jgi:hypothetical protein
MQQRPEHLPTRPDRLKHAQEPAHPTLAQPRGVLDGARVACYGVAQLARRAAWRALQRHRRCGPARAQLPTRRGRGRPALSAQAEAGAARRRKGRGARMGQLGCGKNRPTRRKMTRPGWNGRNRTRRDARRTGPAGIRPLLAQGDFAAPALPELAGNGPESWYAGQERPNSPYAGPRT